MRPWKENVRRFGAENLSWACVRRSPDQTPAQRTTDSIQGDRQKVLLRLGTENLIAVECARLSAQIEICYTRRGLERRFLDGNRIVRDLLENAEEVMLMRFNACLQR